MRSYPARPASEVASCFEIVAQALTHVHVRTPDSPRMHRIPASGLFRQSIELLSVATCDAYRLPYVLAAAAVVVDGRQQRDDGCLAVRGVRLTDQETGLIYHRSTTCIYSDRSNSNSSSTVDGHRPAGMRWRLPPRRERVRRVHITALCGGFDRRRLDRHHCTAPARTFFSTGERNWPGLACRR
jgi:hypothetical protein